MVVRAGVSVGSSQGFQWTPEQQQIIQFPHSCLVWAGAGCGKSTTLRGKLEHLIAQDHSILYQCRVVTFTNKSRDDLRKGLAAIPPHQILTIHQFFAEDFRLRMWDPSFSQLTGRSGDFEIWDPLKTAEHLRILLMKHRNIKVPEPWHLGMVFRYLLQNSEVPVSRPDQAREYLVREWVSVKETLGECFLESVMPGEELPRAPKGFGKHPSWIRLKKLNEALASPVIDTDELMGALRTLMNYWEEYRKKQNAMTFDDLEVWAQQLTVQHQWKWLFVDEFQDTNHRQWEALRARADNIFLVGDPGQSIYSFRGADVDVFHSVANQLPVFKLTRNRRSLQPILDCSQLILPWQMKLDGEPALATQVVTVTQVKDELKACTQRALELWQQGHQDIAVLLPSLGDAGEMIHSLQNFGARVVVGSQDILENPLVRQLVTEYLENKFEGKNWDEYLADHALGWLMNENLIKAIKLLAPLWQEGGDSQLMDLWWGQLRLQASNEELPKDAIKVLTIHSSKGLEFDHVVSAQWFGASGAETDSIRRGPFGLTVSVDGEDNIIRAANNDSGRIKRKEEQDRVRYVAATRAKLTFDMIAEPTDDQLMSSLSQRFPSLDVSEDNALIEVGEVKEAMTLQAPAAVPVPERSRSVEVSVSDLLPNLFCPAWDPKAYPISASFEGSGGASGVEQHRQWEWEVPKWLVQDLGLSGHCRTEAPIHWRLGSHLLVGRVDGLDLDRRIVWDYKTFQGTPFDRVYYGTQVGVYAWMVNQWEKSSEARGVVVWSDRQLQWCSPVTETEIVSAIEQKISPNRVFKCKVCPQAYDCAYRL